MLAYISGRLVSLLLTTLAPSVIVFLLMQVLPGDPAAVILGINAQPETLAALHSSSASINRSGGAMLNG